MTQNPVYWSYLNVLNVFKPVSKYLETELHTKEKEPSKKWEMATHDVDNRFTGADIFVYCSFQEHCT